MLEGSLGDATFLELILGHFGREAAELEIRSPLTRKLFGVLANDNPIPTVAVSTCLLLAKLAGILYSSEDIRMKADESGNFQLQAFEGLLNSKGWTPSLLYTDAGKDSAYFFSTMTLEKVLGALEGVGSSEEAYGRLTDLSLLIAGVTPKAPPTPERRNTIGCVLPHWLPSRDKIPGDWRLSPLPPRPAWADPPIPTSAGQGRQGRSHEPRRIHASSREAPEVEGPVSPAPTDDHEGRMPPPLEDTFGGGYGCPPFRCSPYAG